jgi:hypothetical protein
MAKEHWVQVQNTIFITDMISRIHGNQLAVLFLICSHINLNTKYLI